MMQCTLHTLIVAPATGRRADAAQTVSIICLKLYWHALKRFVVEAATNLPSRRQSGFRGSWGKYLRDEFSTFRILITDY
jgi:hypothetical protein